MFHEKRKDLEYELSGAVEAAKKVFQNEYDLPEELAKEKAVDAAIAMSPEIYKSLTEVYKERDEEE